jgi:hypothetical protein
LLKILLLFAALAGGLWAALRYMGSARPQSYMSQQDSSDTVELSASFQPNTGMGLWSLQFPATGPPQVTFELNIGAKQEASSPGFHFAPGTLRARPGGAPVAFLKALTYALEAADTPSARHPAEQLSIDVGILGEHLSRGISPSPGRVVAGEFAESPRGSWLVTKLFLNEGQAEVYLALSAPLQRALLIKKDPEYGTDVVAEFARLFP